jgi:uncharacterized membrane protein YkgB
MAVKMSNLPAVLEGVEPAVKSAGWMLARYGLALVIGWIGVCKFYPYEAHNIQPLVASSPFMGWLYDVFSMETFSATLGVVELVTALLLIVRPW